MNNDSLEGQAKSAQLNHNPGDENLSLAVGSHRALWLTSASRIRLTQTA
jgi:hypothetical protein